MTATQTIEALKATFINDRFQFDFLVCQYIAGDSNKKLRQEIIKLATGEDKPVSKCGMYAVSNALLSKFQQHELF